MIRGIRGATTVNENTLEEVEKSTKELILELVRRNQLQPEQISFIMITATADITADFPARVIREMEGWQWVPVMCAVEMAVTGAMPLCIRLMISAETDKRPEEIQHVYLHGAASLRPDFMKK